MYQIFRGGCYLHYLPFHRQDTCMLRHPRSSAEGSRKEGEGTSWVRHFSPLSRGHLKSSGLWQRQHPSVWVWNTRGWGNRLMQCSGLPSGPWLSPLLVGLDTVFQRRRASPVVTAPFFPKSLLLSNSVFPSLRLREMGQWWWPTLSIGITWRWTKTPTAVAAPNTQAHAAQSKTKGLRPPLSSLTGLDQDHLLYPNFFSRVLSRLRDLSSELHTQSWQIKASFWRSQQQGMWKAFAIKSKRKKKEIERETIILLKHNYLMLEQLK